MDAAFAAIHPGAREVREAGLAPGVYDLPDRLDRAVVERTPEPLGITIDGPTAAQVDSVDSWRERRS